MQPHELQYRRYYMVRFGTRKEQVARFLGYRGTDAVMEKWKANSGEWTKTLRVSFPTILRPATAADLKQRKVR